MKWTHMYPFQVDSINAWFDTHDELLLMANTASGKTEAAFLPIISSIAQDHGCGSIRVLYVGPLKALINDQFQRLEELCNRAEIPVHRWHGDVGSQKKRKIIKTPSGILLITPESLESLMMRVGNDARRLFLKLDAIVIDELHVFLDSERGRQLASLINRVDVLRLGLPPTRKAGLSATIGDVDIAEKWLSGNTTNTVTVIESSQSSDVSLLIKTFIEEAPTKHNCDQNLEDAKLDIGNNTLSIANHLLSHLTGKTNLVFCNRKSYIEELADRVTEISKKKRIPNQFLVHHGSLSKQFRESVEDELKSNLPRTAICSSTLELGIDIGEVDVVAQVGPPHSVSALKQRMGRSGRREGEPSKLYFYVPIIKCNENSSLPERLYPDLIQSVALVLLMLGQEGVARWTEPPLLFDRDYSTLIQQILSIIVERGGIQTRTLYELLSLRHAFGHITQEEFGLILKDLGKHDLLEQTKNGDLILGLAGERIVSHYEFYAAFETPKTYQVIYSKGTIGEVEGREGFYQAGNYMLLGGRRWEIIDVDEQQMKITVRSARGKKLVQWHGIGGYVHRKIREVMRHILLNSLSPDWLEDNTKLVLDWANHEFHRANLNQTYFFKEGKQLHIFTWTSSRANHALYLYFLKAGLCTRELVDQGIAITITKPDFSISDGITLLRNFIDTPPQPEALCKSVFEEVPPVGKFGVYLSQHLRTRAYAAKWLDVEEAIDAAKKILESDRST